MPDRIRKWIVIAMACFVLMVLAYGIAVKADDQIGDPCDSFSTKYDEVYQRSVVEGKPLLVFLTGKGCSACEDFKRDVLQPMLLKGELSRIVLAIVDREDDKRVADHYRDKFNIKTYPALVLHRKNGAAWKSYTYQAPKNRGSVERLLSKAEIQTGR